MAGQSDNELSLFSAEELEFIAEDETVEIVPKFKMDPLCFISGDFGPFSPNVPTQVPIWLAIALKKRSKCVIRPPQWMTLTQILEAERDSQEMSEQLPFHYIEISRLLFNHARDNIADDYMVRSLIEDIRNVRFHKIETDLEAFNGRTIAVKIKNLSAMEVNIVRPFIGRALQAFYKHDSPDLIPDPERVSDRRPQAANNNAPRRQLRR
ncbi:DNA replication complex GINS protein PSF2 isoform X2 [Lotus japonicus]|uniref:DNA replication complex GINS protein PSF2 isoform X2 n=1 Tax=Lotus japonicus TaxID=34305 RepID=UPI00258B540C|nr:DNA replication complex GINS protein PSF2 isoform X2 [Lotus japonicus]